VNTAAFVARSTTASDRPSTSRVLRSGHSVTINV
jgi:hypothetical protein